MPSLSMGPTVAIKRFRLDNAETLVIHVKQAEGPENLKRERWLKAPIGINDRGGDDEMLFHVVGPIERTGLEASLTLVEVDLTDEDGNLILDPKWSTTKFIQRWASPRLDAICLTADIDGTELQFSYRALITQAVYEVNPTWDQSMFRAHAPEAE
jgi:hypothetical protein